MVNQGTFKHNGVTVTIQRRFVNGCPEDWGYKTSNDLGGIGQSSYVDAERVAKKAIDYHAQTS